MATELLPAICVAVFSVGLLMTGLGGYGVYCFNRKAEPPAAVYEPGKSLTPFLEAQQEMQERFESFEKTLTRTLSGVALIENLRTELDTLRTRLAALEQQEAAAREAAEKSRVPETGFEDQERKLTDEQKAEIVQELKAHGAGAIAIRTAAKNAEAKRFGQDLKSAFQNAGWSVQGPKASPLKSAYRGLVLSVGRYPYSEEVSATYLALSNAGLEITSQIDPKQAGDKAVLIVGKGR